MRKAVKMKKLLSEEEKRMKKKLTLEEAWEKKINDSVFDNAASHSSKFSWKAWEKY